LLGPVPPGGIPLFQPSSILCGLPNLFDALLRRPFVIPERSARYSLLNSLSEREQTVIYRSFVHESGGAFRDIISGGVRVDERRVSCPVLVAVGSRDRTTPPSIARRVARKYGAEYREYPGRCHYLGSAHEVIGDVTKWIMAQVSA
jgi:pimeloyl-ACP methyl ester carboxylesterase